MNSQDAKSSPEMSKKAKARQMKSPQTAPPDALVDLPGSAVKKSMGIPEAVFQFLEVSFPRLPMLALALVLVFRGVWCGAWC